MEACRTCGKPLSLDEIERKRLQRIEKIKSSLAVAERKGRPRKVDGDNIRKLRSSGLSVQRIADTLGVSKRTIQYAMKRTSND